MHRRVDCPRWWVWLQEIAVFTQSSRAAIMEVYDHMQFICALNGGTVCINSGSGDKFPCSTPIIDDKCYVDGRTILEVTQGIGKADSFWNYFGALCAIFVFFKAGVILLTVYPWERVVFKVGSILYPSKVDLRELQKVRNEQKLESLLTSDLSSEVMSLSPGASLTWTGLSVILPNSNKILIDNVSGSVSNGKVLALMGPSGAGKTTLLNALAKRASYARVEGQILYGGRAMTATDLTYVPQFDEVNRILTVLEVMTLVGKLTCVDETEMNQRLEIVISVLGLQSKRNAQIKNLSGGEVKRVSVGIGLISKPHVLFLDEPTTGLDSTASYSIVKYLVQIAKTTNVAVIMTIHQPSALMFDMLDDLLLLETGRIAYGGSVKAAALYFSNVGFANPHMINPADYYLELVQKNPSEDGRTWRDLLEGSIQGSDYVEQIDAILAAKVEIAPTIQPSAFSRYVTLFNYFMVYFFREPGFYRSRTIALSIIAIYAGTIFLQLTPTTHNISNYVGAMFFSVIAMMLTAVSSTALFAKDRYEAVDRVKNGIYTPAVFVLAQFSAAAIYNLIAAFIFASIFHWLVNINPNGESFIFDIFIGWGHMMLMEAVLLTVIEALKNDFLSTTSGMVFLGSCMAFSGFFRAVDQMPPWISWMSYILPLKYTFDGFVWQIFHTQSFAITGSNPTTYISGDDVLSTVFNLSNINSWGMFGVCLAYVALFRLNQYTLFAWQMDMLFTKTEKTITTVKKATLAARGTNDSFKVSSNSLAAKNDMNV
jgi:ABC-type multidrug transport system ATPase subunit/ABC-type multidrug transport system permease subunit